MRYRRPDYLLQPQLIRMRSPLPLTMAGLGAAPPVADDMDLQTNYGIFGQPKVLAADYAPMEAMLIRIIDEKVRPIPWIPSDWFARISQARDTYPDWRFVIQPCLGIFGNRLSTAPAWLDTDEKLQVWQTIAKDMQRAIFLYAQKKSEEGQIILDDLYSKSAFWDRAYSIVKVIADAPGVFMDAAGDFASGMTGKFLKGFWPVLLVVGAGAVLYYGRKQIFSAAGGRLARSIR